MKPKKSRPLGKVLHKTTDRDLIARSDVLDPNLPVFAALVRKAKKLPDGTPL